MSSEVETSLIKFQTDSSTLVGMTRLIFTVLRFYGLTVFINHASNRRHISQFRLD